jgi:hypothetical protein
VVVAAGAAGCGSVALMHRHQDACARGSLFTGWIVACKLQLVHFGLFLYLAALLLNGSAWTSRAGVYVTGECKGTTARTDRGRVCYLTHVYMHGTLMSHELPLDAWILLQVRRVQACRAGAALS